MTLALRNVQVDVPAGVHDAAVAYWAAALDEAPRHVDAQYEAGVVLAAPGGHLHRVVPDRRDGQ